MKVRSLLLPVLAGFPLLVCTTVARAAFADAVIDYTPGTGFATEFGSGLGYTNSASALGEPSRVTPGDFGGPVDPFSPPYLREQLVSLGAGGSLTVKFNAPVANHPLNPFNLDFLIFGNNAFIITNGDYTGGGITDGSLFGTAAGPVRVSVSADGENYFTLDPALAPIVDWENPTDGSGDFSRPVDPELSGGDFAGQGLAGIRQLYAGAGGGTGFDISWARDGGGNPVDLTEISFVRVSVLADRVEIDGVSGVSAVPEPASWALFGAGAVLLLGERIRRSRSRTIRSRTPGHR